MRRWLLSTQGAVTLSILTLLSHVWRGFLDAMFVLPVDFGDESTLNLAALIFTALFAAWGLVIWSAWQGSRRGLVTLFVINGLVLFAIPISWLLFYCPTDCRADAGVFNLANSMNLILGLLAGVSLASLVWRRPHYAANMEG